MGVSLSPYPQAEDGQPIPPTRSLDRPYSNPVKGLRRPRTWFARLVFASIAINPKQSSPGIHMRSRVNGELTTQSRDLSSGQG